MVRAYATPGNGQHAHDGLAASTNDQFPRLFHQGIESPQVGTHLPDIKLFHLINPDVLRFWKVKHETRPNTSSNAQSLRPGRR